MAHRHGTDARDHPLVAVRAAHLLQALVVAVDEARAGLFGALDELPHALVAARGVDVDVDDGARRRLQPHGDGMEAEEDLVTHRAMVSARFHPGVTGAA